MQVPDDDEDVPYLGALLTLRPRQHERHFWKSETYRSAAGYLDVWHAYVTVVVNLLYLRFHTRLFYKVLPGSCFACCYIAVALVQLLCARKWPAEYYDLRGHIVLANRVVRFCAFFRTPFNLRHMITARSAVEQVMLTIRGSTELLHIPPALTLTKHLILASATVFPAIHSVNMPLPFLQQVIVHALYVVVLVVFQLQPAIHILQYSGQSGSYKDACRLLNVFLQMGAAMCNGTSLDIMHLDQQCQAHSLRMLVLLADIYFGFLIPVYVSYQLELQMKLAYIDAMLRQAGGNPPGWQRVPPVWLPGLSDVSIMGLLGVVSWVLVLLYHEHMAQFAVVL